MQTEAPLQVPKLASSLANIPILPVSDVADKLRLLIFGPTGAGKTYLSGTASLVPEMAPILVLDFEGGTKTLKTNFPAAPIDVIRPKGAGPGRWPYVEAIYEDLKAKGGGGYKTLVIDSLSEAYEVCMEWWLAQEYKRNTNRDPDIPGEDAGLHERGAPTDYGRDWNKVRSVVRRMVRGFRDLDTHIIFTCLSDQKKDKTGPLIQDVPSFPGKLAGELPGFLDEICYLFARETGKTDPDSKLPIVERRLQTQATDKRPFCKSRGNLPLLMQDATVADIVEAARIPL